MPDPSHLEMTNEKKKIGTAYLCLHGHFYHPPRDDPFTGHIPVEPAATPFANFNEKITTECYRPNTEAGNFDAINFDLGPTLAAWLEDAHEDVYQSIIEADRKHLARYGVGNAMAQAFHHTTQVDITINGRPHWSKSWSVSVPRAGC